MSGKAETAGEAFHMDVWTDRTNGSIIEFCSFPLSASSLPDTDDVIEFFLAMKDEMPFPESVLDQAIHALKTRSGLYRGVHYRGPGIENRMWSISIDYGQVDEMYIRVTRSRRWRIRKGTS